MMQQNLMKNQAMQAVQSVMQDPNAWITNPNGTHTLSPDSARALTAAGIMIDPRYSVKDTQGAVNENTNAARDQGYAIDKQNNEAVVKSLFPTDPQGVEANSLRTLTPAQQAAYFQFKESKTLNPAETLKGPPIPSNPPPSATSNSGMPSGAGSGLGGPQILPMPDGSPAPVAQGETGLAAALSQATGVAKPSPSFPANSIPQAMIAPQGGAVTLAQSSAPIAPHEIPAEGQKSIMDNVALIQRLDQARQLVSAHPDAIGPKNYLPGSQFFENINGSPENNQTRAALNGLTMAEMHNQFGARLTDSEFEKNAASVATTTNTAPNAINKLNLMRGAAQRELTNLGQVFSPQAGYVVPPELDTAIKQYSTAVGPTATAPALQVPGGVNPSTAPAPSPAASAVTSAMTPPAASAGPATAVAQSASNPPSTALPAASPAPSPMASVLTGAMGAGGAQPQATPMPGGGGMKTMDPSTAAQMMQQAGGDPAKARQMATQAGFQF
jgi:hypothetical protein